MGEILQAKFTDYTNDDGDYPDVSHISQAAAFPRPKQTIASEAVLIARQKAQEKVFAKKIVLIAFGIMIANNFILPVLDYRQTRSIFV